MKLKSYKMFVGLKDAEHQLPTNEINFYIGPMNFCSYGCGAKHFKNESTKKNVVITVKVFFKHFILIILI